MVIATEAHRQGLFQKLQTEGFDLGAVIRSGSYTSIDVHETLSLFMPKGQPDPARLGQAVSRLVKTASNGRERLDALLPAGSALPFYGRKASWMRRCEWKSSGTRLLTNMG